MARFPLQEKCRIANKHQSHLRCDISERALDMRRNYVGGISLDGRRSSLSSRFSKPNQKVPISCMFLSHFEMKKGNVIVWSKKWSDTNCDVDLQDIELKSIPSGVHEVTDDVINFVISKNKSRGEDYYYGVAYFRQNGHEMAKNSLQLDRGQVKMYSLGVVVNPNYRINGTSNSGFYEWGPSQFTSANEYVNDLEELLSHWFRVEDFENFGIFERYFDANSLANSTTELSSPVLQRSGKGAREFLPLGDRSSEDATEVPNRRQMLEYLPYWIRRLGPLIFSLWKSCLLNERVLIINPAGGLFEVCNALSYCLSIISLIPKILQVNRQEDYYVRPLFTIGVSDIDGLMSEFVKETENHQKTQGYIASTSDEILAYKTDMYDKLLRIPPDFLDGFNTQNPTFFTNSEVPVKATPYEYELIEDLFTRCLHEDVSVGEMSLYLNQVEPVSWSQYIIDGVYWWATAGYIKASFHETLMKPDMISGNDNDIETVIDIVGFFHDRTANIFNKLRTMITLADQSEPRDVISIPFKALRDMDLDCFSAQDHEFVIQLAQKWFQRKIRISGDYYKAFC